MYFINWIHLPIETHPLEPPVYCIIIEICYHFIRHVPLLKMTVPVYTQYLHPLRSVQCGGGGGQGATNLRAPWPR